MTLAISHSWYMTVRYLRSLSRQPWLISVSLVQPVLWLLLFGQLFKRIVEIPGFGGGSYITFLVPGVVIMTAVFSAAWAAMGPIADIDRGVTDRFLTSPVRRGALTSGQLIYQALVSIVQSVIIVVLGVAVGARFNHGVLGLAVLVAAAMLLNLALSALSIALGLVLRKEESVIGVVNFIALPLTFIGGGFMDERLIPGWMQAVARFNPVNWAVQAGREALDASVDWSLVLSRGGLLLALALVSGWIATWAFRSYQRSV